MKYLKKATPVFLCTFLLFSYFGCQTTDEPTPIRTEEEAAVEAERPIVYFTDLLGNQQFKMPERYQEFLKSNRQFLKYPIDHEGREKSIFHHPVDGIANQIIFNQFEVPQQAVIETGISIFVRNAERVVSDGVRFKISAQSGDQTKVVLDEVLTDFNVWKDVAADLTEFAGQNISIIFETDGNGTTQQDWAVWGSPTLVQSSITKGFESKEYKSAQKFNQLIKSFRGKALAEGVRTDRGWVLKAETTEVILPQLTTQDIVRAEVFVLYPSKKGNNELTISLVDGNGKALKTVVHDTSKEGRMITQEFDLNGFPVSSLSLNYSVEPGSAATLFLKQPIVRSSLSSADAANVILISLDTLRPDYLGCYGNEIKGISPNIDALAAESLLFRNAYSSSNWTLPAHTSLFTSLYPADHQVVLKAWGGGPVFIPIEPDHYYVTEAFKESKYVTMAFTGGGFVDSRYGYNRGFDYHIENVKNFNNATLDDLVSLVELNRDTPHFLFFHTFEIHDYTNQKAEHRRYVTKQFWSGNLPFERRLSSQHFLDLPTFKHIAAEVLPEEGTQYAKELYAGAVTYTDRILGSFFDQLREMNLFDRSWIILTSDHGEGFGERHNNGGLSSWRHGWRLYDDQIRIPLIVKPPKGLSTRNLPLVEEQVVELTDIAPTLMAILGKKPHSQFIGQNLLPAFVKPNAISSRTAFSDDSRNKQFSVIADGYKLLMSPDPYMISGTQFELYNLSKDGPERFNLAKNMKDSDLLENLKLLLDQHTKAIASGGLGVSSNNTQEIDEEHLQRLKDLGYIQ
jgi:arylsulfatase A-like enzyme